MLLRACRPLLLLFALALLPGPVLALTLSLGDSFAFTDASGIAYDAASGNLFVADGSSTITELTTSGDLVSSFDTGLTLVHGLSFLPNGNLLISDLDGANSGVHEYTTGGSVVGSGIQFVSQPPSNDGDGVIYHPGTGTIFITDDVDESIYEFDVSGTLLNTISTTSIAAAFTEPEGVTVDPFTGHLLVVDDAGGSSSLYELTTTGLLVDVFDMQAITGLTDAEGITIDAASRTLFVAFNSQNSVVSLSAPIPEPGAALCFALGVSVMGAVSRRPHRA